LAYTVNVPCFPDVRTTTPFKEQSLLLFVALLKATAGTPEERIARRAQWQYPEGMQTTAEYWLQTADPVVALVFERRQER
jgi:hypothetical protein